MDKQLKLLQKTAHEMRQPVHIRALYEKIGTNEGVGALLGLSASAISEALRKNETRAVNELAAVWAWNANYATPAKEAYQFAIIKAPPHIIETMRDLVAASGGSVSVLDK